MIVLVGALWFLIVGGARAAEPPPIVSVADDAGVWRTELVIPAPIEAVRLALADPIAAARFSPDIRTIRYLSHERCPTLRVELGLSIAPVAYDYRRCPTETGWRETLVSSRVLAVYDARWSFEAVEAGTKVRYDVKVQPIGFAPAFVMARQIRVSVAALLTELYRSVTGAEPAG